MEFLGLAQYLLNFILFTILYCQDKFNCFYFQHKVVTLNNSNNKLIVYLNMQFIIRFI